MSVPDSDPIDLERQGWLALSSGPQAARAFYERILDHAVTMLLPGGIILDDRQAIIDAMSGQPWSSFELDNVRSLRLSTDSVVVFYEAVAFRGEQRYSALMSSVYVQQSDTWKLAFHQQTPR
jgi:hypothetical protein